MRESRPRSSLRALIPRVDGYALRRLAYLGSRYGPEPLVRYSPAILGTLFGLVLAKKRRQVRKNLRRILGQRAWLVEQADVLRTFVRYAHCVAESLGADRPAASRTVRHLVGESCLTEELDRGRGVILVTAHTGMWDVAARAFAERLGVEVLIVMQREADAQARQLHDSVRARRGVGIVHVDHPLDGIALLKHLRGGGVVAIQIDRVAAGSRFLEVSLLGAPFRVPEGPFLLAAATGAALVPVFVRRCGYFEQQVAFCEARRLPRRPAPKDLADAAESIAAELARFVRAYPNDWFHFDEG